MKRSNENNAAVQNIQDKIEKEISEIRNVTYQMSGENAGKHSLKFNIYWATWTTYQLSLKHHFKEYIIIHKYFL